MLNLEVPKPTAAETSLTIEHGDLRPVPIFVCKHLETASRLILVFFGNFDGAPLPADGRYILTCHVGFFYFPD